VRRIRWIIVVSVLVALLVAMEIGVRRWERPKACLQIINEGQAFMEDVVVIYDGNRTPVGRIYNGQSAQLWLTAGPRGPLRVEYHQKTNAIQGFEIADYDPTQNLMDGFKQVLVLGTNKIQRYVEDDDAHKDERTLGERIWDWFKSELEPAP
jgi:hypothetical protein